MRSLIIVAALLSGLAAGAGAAEELGPEALLPLHEARDAYTPGAAFGANTFLVVWQSGRLAEGDLRKGINYAGDIVGCRVDASGKAVDAKPFVISGAKDLQERPFAAFGEGVFLVVWQDLRNEKDWDVYATRVSSEGKVLDADGILVSGGAHNQAEPRVAWDGKTFLVVWQDFRSGKRYEAFGARVSAGGRVLDEKGLVLGSGDFYNCTTPAVASAGGGRSLVTWVGCCEGGMSYAVPASVTLFVADGKVVAPEAHRHKFSRDHGPGEGANGVVLAAGPGSYVAAWTTDGSCGNGRLGLPGASNAAVYDAEGKRGKNLLLAGIDQTPGKKWPGPLRIRNPDLTWDGSAFVAAWHMFKSKGERECPYEIASAVRVKPDGEPAGPMHLLSGTAESPAREAAVASDGKGTSLIAYEKHPEKAEAPIKIGFRILSAK